MIDAPCGAMIWMPYLLTNLSSKFERKFRFFGVDIVEMIINASIKRFSNYSDPTSSTASFQNYTDEWRFAVFDFTEEMLRTRMN